MDASIPQKLCSKCKQEFPATNEYFHKNAGAKSGLSTACKTCACRTARNWFAANPERAKITKHLYYLENQDEIKARVKSYGDANPELISQRKADYYQEHKPTILVRVKKWAEDNREKSNEIKYAWAKRNPEYRRMVSRLRRERVKNAEGTFTKQDVYRLYDEQDGLCAYCGIRILWEIPNDIHIDHIHAIARGGSNWPDNLCLACADCNLSKQDKTIAEWQIARGW